ncbi:MAG: DUF2284 domain-containing protein [Desulfobacteraceae bacterium]|nr:DUF2284 domain-containing protein [Desulfobacteraceae bacterium]
MKQTKIVPFEKAGGIGLAALAKRLLGDVEHHGITDIIPFKVEDIQVAEWVHLKCRYGCSRYNTSWCCPPATPEPDKIRRILSEYTSALLLEGRKTCTDFYRNNGRKRTIQVRCWKETVSLERKLFLEGYYKAFSLVGECCALCKACAYPDACRFPQEKRPSVESFSIDVFGTLDKLGRATRLATRTTDTFNYYGIILLD